MSRQPDFETEIRRAKIALNILDQRATLVASLGQLISDYRVQAASMLRLLEVQNEQFKNSVQNDRTVSGTARAEPGTDSSQPTGVGPADPTE